jgi:hypothetical protein
MVIENALSSIRELSSIKAPTGSCILASSAAMARGGRALPGLAGRVGPQGPKEPRETTTARTEAPGCVNGAARVKVVGLYFGQLALAGLRATRPGPSVRCQWSRGLQQVTGESPCH